MQVDVDVDMVFSLHSGCSSIGQKKKMKKAGFSGKHLLSCRLSDI